MKTFKNFVVMTLVLSMILTSCQTKKSAPKVKEAKTVAVKIEEITPKINEVDRAFIAQISSVYEAYNGVKDALVLSDSSATLSAVNVMLSNLDKVDMGLLKKPKSHKVWMSQKPILKQNLTKMTGEATLAIQRQSFLELSNSMILLVENFGTSHKVMVQFCPMADDFKGGYWLSMDAKIKNPYFGDKMLTCGSTKRIIN